MSEVCAHEPLPGEHCTHQHAGERQRLRTYQDWIVLVMYCPQSFITDVLNFEYDRALWVGEG